MYQAMSISFSCVGFDIWYSALQSGRGSESGLEADYRIRTHRIGSFAIGWLSETASVCLHSTVLAKVVDMSDVE